MLTSLVKKLDVHGIVFVDIWRGIDCMQQILQGFWKIYLIPVFSVILVHPKSFDIFLFGGGLRYLAAFISRIFKSKIEKTTSTAQLCANTRNIVAKTIFSLENLDFHHFIRKVWNGQDFYWKKLFFWKKIKKVIILIK